MKNAVAFGFLGRTEDEFSAVPRLFDGPGVPQRGADDQLPVHSKPKNGNVCLFWRLAGISGVLAVLIAMERGNV